MLLRLRPTAQKIFQFFIESLSSYTRKMILHTFLLSLVIAIQTVVAHPTFANGTSRPRVCEVVNPTQGALLPGFHGGEGSPKPAVRFNYTSEIADGDENKRYYEITFDPYGITNPEIIGWAFQVRTNGDRSANVRPFGSIQKSDGFISDSQLSPCEGDDGHMHLNMISNKNVGEAYPEGFAFVKFKWYEDDGDGTSVIVCPRIVFWKMLPQFFCSKTIKLFLTHDK